MFFEMIWVGKKHDDQNLICGKGLGSCVLVREIPRISGWSKVNSMDKDMAMDDPMDNSTISRGFPHWF